MNIIWKPNPLASIVELDDRDKERLLLAYQEEHLCFILIRIENGIQGKYKPKWTLEEAEKEAAKWRKIAEMDVDSPEITKLADELKTIHIGDCTCVACTCMKCYAESYLGISTIEGLGSHEATKIWSAFVKDDPDGYDTSNWHGDIDLALKNLSEPISETPNRHYEGKEDLWKSCIPRWESERKNAYNWLKAYKEEHGF